jgi:hypothetical protein
MIRTSAQGAARPTLSGWREVCPNGISVVAEVVSVAP